MQSMDLDFPKECNSYVTASQLGDYIQDYADTFGVTKFARFNSVVNSITPSTGKVKGCSSESAWKVQWTSGSVEHSQEFDAVAVASGHYDVPYKPELPGQEEWLSGGSGLRSITHSKFYNQREDFEGLAVLVVGGRSSGVDIARELRSSASWVYCLEKNCTAATTTGTVTHVPLGTRLCADGQMQEVSTTSRPSSRVSGPPVDRVILATGYEFDFPFLDAEQLGMHWQRSVSPLYLHLLHAQRPGLAFLGIPLSIPCPIPFFEAQARFLGAHWATTATQSEAEQMAWVETRRMLVGERPQDMHLMSVGCSAWDYMEELMARADVSSAEYQRYCERLRVVEQIYFDRKSKQPALPWEDDWYRQCEYVVSDWEQGQWTVQHTRTADTNHLPSGTVTPPNPGH
jgi:cation diffusion facilitator CzcD-associated flavoprotein CzcO